MAEPGPSPAQTVAGGRAAAPLAVLVAGAACAVVAGLQLGGRGVLSAVVATVVVVAFFSGGVVPLLLGQGGLGLPLLLLNSVTRLLLVLFVLVVAAAAGGVDRAAMGLSVVVCALVWTTASALALTRSGA